MSVVTSLLAIHGIHDALHIQPCVSNIDSNYWDSCTSGLINFMEFNLSIKGHVRRKIGYMTFDV